MKRVSLHLLLICLLQMQAISYSARKPVIQTHIRHQYEPRRYKVLSSRIDPGLRVGRGEAKKDDFEADDENEEQEGDSDEKKTVDIMEAQSKDPLEDDVNKELKENVKSNFKPLKHENKIIISIDRENLMKSVSSENIIAEHSEQKAESTDDQAFEKKSKVKDIDYIAEASDISKGNVKEQKEIPDKKQNSNIDNNNEAPVEYGEDYMNSDEAIAEIEKEKAEENKASALDDIDAQPASLVNRTDIAKFGENDQAKQENRMAGRHKFNIQSNNDDILFSSDEVKVISDLVQHRLSLLAVINQKLGTSGSNRLGGDRTPGNLAKYDVIEDTVVTRLPQNLEQELVSPRKGLICQCGEIVEESNLPEPARVMEAQSDDDGSNESLKTRHQSDEWDQSVLSESRNEEIEPLDGDLESEEKAENEGMDEDTDKTDEDTDKTDEDTDNSDEDTDKSDEDTDKSDEDTDNSDEDTDKSDKDTDKSDEDTDNSDEDTDNSDEDTDKSDEDVDQLDEEIDKLDEDHAKDLDFKEKKSNDEQEDYDDQDEDRIVNGYSVKRREYYVALERRRGFVTCGAALISPRYVLSAGHCFCLNLKKDSFCEKELVTSDIPYRLAMGVTSLRERSNARYYSIESVRQPAERIQVYARGRTEGPHDIALIRTRRTVILEPGRIMPVCLGPVKDINVMGHVTGLGAHASFSPKKKFADCWTDGKGPKMFTRCNSLSCNSSSLPPQHSICEQFFKFFGGPEMFRSTQEADVAEVDGKRCYALDGSGKYGWCKADDSWGFCSYHCSQPGPTSKKDLQEVNPRVLMPEDCQAMIEEDMLFDPEVDLCAGQIISRFQRVMQFQADGEEFKAGKRVYSDKLKIGGKDACQGDSGGPMVRIVKVRKRGRIMRKAFLIGLVSRGTGCAYAQSPGIYVRVSAFLPWLQKHMKPGETCINSY